MKHLPERVYWAVCGDFPGGPMKAFGDSQLQAHAFAKETASRGHEVTMGLRKDRNGENQEWTPLRTYTTDGKVLAV